MRGVIPAVCLEYLEKQLQVMNPVESGTYLHSQLLPSQPCSFMEFETFIEWTYGQYRDALFGEMVARKNIMEGETDIVN